MNKHVKLATMNTAHGPRTSFISARIAISSASVIAAMLAIAALTLLSPEVLRAIGRNRGFDWPRLSDVGQTYGLASAILSGTALIGIALSLIVQARQAQAERVSVVRERHMDLLRLVLEDPELYGPVIGVLVPSEPDDARRFVFSTMWMNYASMGYQMGILDENTVRKEILRSSFGSQYMRDWWGIAGEYWRESPGPGRKALNFVRIADDEFLKSIRTPKDSRADDTTTDDDQS